MKIMTEYSEYTPKLNLPNREFVELGEVEDIVEKHGSHESRYLCVWRYSTPELHTPHIADLYLDFDCVKNPGRAKIEALKAVEYFQRLGVPEDQIRVFFSGRKGFNIFISSEVFGMTPNEDAHEYMGEMVRQLKKKLKFKHIDTGIYYDRCLMRITNTVHDKSGLYKVQLPHAMLHDRGMDKIKKYAEEPKALIATESEVVAIPNCVKLYEIAREAAIKRLNERRLKVKASGDWTGRMPPCIESMIAKGVDEGGREQRGFIIAACLTEFGAPEDHIVERVNEFWDNCAPPLSDVRRSKDLPHILDTCGKYTYGCTTPQLQEFCPGKELCWLFDKEPKGRGRPSELDLERRWVIDLGAKVTRRIECCGFYGDLVTEAVRVPMQNPEDGTVETKAAMLSVTSDGEAKLENFILAEGATGSFISGLVTTPMSVPAIQRLMSGEGVDLKQIDAALGLVISQFVDIEETYLMIAKRWIEATFFWDVFDTFVLLFITGASDSGKTQLLKVVCWASYHGELFEDPTPASVFRIKHIDKPTVCIDEGEKLSNKKHAEDLRMLLNASYSKGVVVPRMEKVGEVYIPKGFRIYGPLAINAINMLEGVLGSRSIPIVMFRSVQDKEWAEPQPKAFDKVRDDLYIARMRYAFEVRKVYDELDISDIVRTRHIQLFKPLFVMTKMFGTAEEWNTLADFARRVQDIYKIEASNVEGELKVYCAIAQIFKGDGWYRIMDIVASAHGLFEMNVRTSLKSRRVSHILNKLGMKERKHGKDGNLARISEGALETVSLRLGFPDHREVDATMMLRATYDSLFGRRVKSMK